MGQAWRLRGLQSTIGIRNRETPGAGLYGLHAFFIWLHILGVALWTGPQVYLAVGWPGAARQIPDLQTKVNTIRVLTRRLAYLGGFGLVLLVAAGTYFLFTWRDYYAIPDDVGFFDLRFGVVWAVKMAVVAVMLAVTSLHMFVVGPGQLAAMEAEGRGEPGSGERLRRARQHSRMLSGSGLALTFAIMGLGAMLNTAAWSMQEW